MNDSEKIVMKVVHIIKFSTALYKLLFLIIIEFSFQVGKIMESGIIVSFVCN